MNSSELDRLGSLIEEGTVPAWVRDFVEGHRQEIVAALNEGRSYRIPGPDGQTITIEAQRQVAA